ncbi:hypothetical protein F4821DRAFT_220966 [Hypoxylon rubiginosum]|uniref:Uncharacterized protein n=1 Tax=Hypoxylon rubiginosum TaxID=110542 RepID=A0ACC0DN43_9PEZI|nr:hypothetical protein F4821DRAFT_220966 [Hypoxylon rubiginosum]
MVATHFLANAVTLIAITCPPPHAAYMFIAYYDIRYAPQNIKTKTLRRLWKVSQPRPSFRFSLDWFEVILTHLSMIRRST